MLRRRLLLRRAARVVVVLVVAIVATALVTAAARHPARAGAPRSSPAGSAGRRRCCSPPGSTTGTGVPTGSCSVRSRSGSRRRWRWRSRSTSWRDRARSPSASAPVSSSRPVRSGRCGRGSRCSVGTASWCSSRAVRASGRSSPPPVGRSATEGGGRGASPARARGGRRGLREARTDRRDARRPHPARVCDELASLQNRVAPEPVESVRPVLEAELGGPVDEVFAEFDWEPLAAASIGQTYRARLRTGEAVVVKIQRPGIDDVIERDLAALALLANVAQRRTTFGQGLRSGEMLAQFAVESPRPSSTSATRPTSWSRWRCCSAPTSRGARAEASTPSTARVAFSCRSTSTASPSPRSRELDAAGIDRKTLGRGAAALDARAGAADRTSSTPTRIRGTSSPSATAVSA